MPLAENAERAMQAVERQASGRDARAEGTVRLTASEALSGAHRHPGAGDLIARKLFAANCAMYAAPDPLARRGAPSPIGAQAGHDVIGFDETLSRTPGGERLGIVGTRDVFPVVHPDLAKVARVRAVIDFVVEVTERERALLSREDAA